MAVRRGRILLGRIGKHHSRFAGRPPQYLWLLGAPRCQERQDDRRLPNDGRGGRPRGGRGRRRHHRGRGRRGNRRDDPHRQVLDTHREGIDQHRKVQLSVHGAARSDRIQHERVGPVGIVLGLFLRDDGRTGGLFQGQALSGAPETSLGSAFDGFAGSKPATDGTHGIHDTDSHLQGRRRQSRWWEGSIHIHIHRGRPVDGEHAQFVGPRNSQVPIGRSSHSARFFETTTTATTTTTQCETQQERGSLLGRSVRSGCRTGFRAH
mmetsp:Transcript_3018/g.8269  ORF Transcript_3018/g.8269 Transcript_3018/m.8269 type:complete len:264 (+) Transcript_3018:628-1419(+)